MNDLIMNNHKVRELNSELENAVKLKAIVMICFKIGIAIAGLLVEKTLTERAKNASERPDCPKCGSPLESKGFVDRTISTIVGKIGWKRRVWRCKNNCAIGQVAPYDTELGLEPNQRTGNEIKEMVCCLAVFLPFEIAVLMMNSLTGIQVSPTSVWNWVQSSGSEAKARLESELEGLREKFPEVEMIPEEIEKMILAMGADGVMVPFRPDGGQPDGKTIWKEIKVGIFARLGSRLTKKGKEVKFIARKRVVAVLGTVEDLKQRMKLTAIKEGILKAKSVVWLSDGGRGLWGVYDEFSDYAQGVLDFYHAVQNIWKAAKKWFDGRTAKAREWFKSARKRLRSGIGQGIINEINLILNTDDTLDDSVRKTLENLVKYLTTHKNHIEYERYKALGLPIGSGMVESTCKWLIQQRFKGVGMRWSEDGFNNLLHLRLAWINGNYAELFN